MLMLQSLHEIEKGVSTRRRIDGVVADDSAV